MQAKAAPVKRLKQYKEKMAGRVLMLLGHF
jgi:hypothetical protein